MRSWVTLQVRWAAAVADGRTSPLAPANLADLSSLDRQALVRVMTRHPIPAAGAYVVRPPGQHPARKIRVMTELLIEYFEQSPLVATALKA